MWPLRAFGLMALAMLAACANAPPPATGSAGAVVRSAPAPAGVLAGNAQLAIYLPQAGDTLEGIAAGQMGDAARAWEIAELNGGKAPQPGVPLVLPLKPVNPGGVRPDRYQTVPILCYHRLGPGSSKMLVSAANFAQQMDWLAANGWRVLALKDVLDFLQGHRALPPKSVVLTFDDGYESVYRHAFPVLKKHGFAATVFVYTDFMGAGDALSWAQIQEMNASGLVDIQAHSKTHANLIERAADEGDARYRQRMDLEARAPREAIAKRLPQHEVLDYAYPFGDANDVVLDAMVRNHYRLAVTVNPGGNPFYAQPLMLRRTMIFGNYDLEAFKAHLQISRPVRWP
jgi:peptidoglycan/xylan/chitin deacetylase (PgdA/CDA1 family)